jgi:hypothetical protein
MNEKVNSNTIFSCNLCNKIYSSKSSLCNHNKKVHNELKNNIITPIKPPDNPIVIPTNQNKKYLCTYCNYEFNHAQNRWRHEQKCKNKEKNIDEIANLKEQNKKLESTINELKIQVTMILKEKGKIHHKTLQKINNQLNNININTAMRGVFNGVKEKAIYDTFERADGLLQGSTASSGQTWVLGGAGASSAAIINNCYTASANTYAYLPYGELIKNIGCSFSFSPASSAGSVRRRVRFRRLLCTPTCPNYR